MSRVKEELKADVRARYGAEASEVIDYLFEMGTLDDALARRHVVKIRFDRQYCSTTSSARAVMEDIAFDLGLTRIGVFQIVGK